MKTEMSVLDVPGAMEVGRDYKRVFGGSMQVTFHCTGVKPCDEDPTKVVYTGYADLEDEDVAFLLGSLSRGGNA